MPNGKVLDPRLNAQSLNLPEEELKDYGFLIEKETGHPVLYLKDRDSKTMGNGTPVVYNQLQVVLHISGVPYTIDLAVIERPDGDPDDLARRLPAVTIQNAAFAANYDAIRKDKRDFENKLHEQLQKSVEVVAVTAVYKYP